VKGEDEMRASEAIENGLQRHHAGDLLEAEKIYAAVLQTQPNNSDALHLMGVVRYQRCDFVQAETFFRRAVQINPEYHQAFNNLGLLLTRTGRVREAIDCFERALQLNPHDAGTLNNLGLARAARGDIHAAISTYREAICLKPDYADAYNNLGNALRALGQTDNALRSYEYAVHLKPDYAEAYNNLANILAEKAEVEQAALLYHAALKHNNRYVAALNNLGKISREQHFLEASHEYYRRSIEIDPDESESHWGLANLLLLEGKFEEGWNEYEWRWSLAGCPDRLETGRPLWDGSDLAGKTILLYTEQGMGDAIQFLRYAPMVAERNGIVIVQCQRELASLAASVRGVTAVVPRGDPVLPFDVQCPIMSLPRIFGTTLDSIPSIVPYLHPRAAVVKRWQRRMVPYRDSLRVGLVWSGSPTHANDRQRSLHLSAFEPLSDLSDVRLFSLQKGDAGKQAALPIAGMSLVNWTDDLVDFEETAGFIRTMDLVITVDTAVAHLAGAIGKATWLLLPFAPDWRWLLNEKVSRWYPTMRLYRQATPGSWGPVVSEVMRDLANEAVHVGSVRAE
jgi:tetratricopeptide (TPR) repeat protein